MLLIPCLSLSDIKLTLPCALFMYYWYRICLYYRHRTSPEEGCMNCKQHLVPNAQGQVPRKPDLKDKNRVLRKKGVKEKLSTEDLKSDEEALPRE